MADNKKERKLPGKDYFHNYKGDENTVKRKVDISYTDKIEFAEAFSDDEDVKTYTPTKKEEPVKAETAPAPSSQEDLYALPEFNSDEFFASLTATINMPKAEAPAEEKADATKAFKKVAEDNVDHTRTFTKEEKVQVLEVNEDAGKDVKDTKEIKATSKTSKLESLTDTISSTMHFNLRAKNKSQAQNKQKKNLMQNFRVLSKNKDDRTILEAAPVGKGGKTFADSVKAKEGEDIFEAVEKAYLDKQKDSGANADLKALRKERNEIGAVKAEGLKQQFTKDIEKHKKGMIIYGILFVLSAILTLFFSETSFYAYISLIISVVACVLSLPIFKNSINAIKSFSAVSDTALAVLGFFAIIHNICVIALGIKTTVYAICVVFACFARIGSAYYKTMNRSRMVSMAAKSKGLSIMQRIPVKNDAKSFASKLNDDAPDIFYCTDAFLDVGIEEPDNGFTKENKYYIFAMSAVLLASVLVGIFCFLADLAGLSFVTALTATVCALMPVMYDPLSRLIFFNNGKEMLKQGACISGREALTHIGKSDGFVLDAKDVFSAEVTRFRKSAITQIAQTDSAVFAALLAREADSVIAPCFDDFLEQMNITLPPVENFLYEEKQGYSAWVLDRKILVGNRKMLINHSIDVPSKEHEKAYGKGKHVMYVVIDGEITATFLLSYKVLSSLKKYSRDFNKTGLVIMLSSKEPFLDEETVGALLSIDASSVKVLSPKAMAIMDKYNSDSEKQTPTGLICSGKKRSIMHLIMGCYNANAADRLILSMLLLGQGLGFLLLILSPILNMPIFMNPLAIVALRLIWGVVVNTVISRKK